MCAAAFYLAQAAIWAYAVCTIQFPKGRINSVSSTRGINFFRSQIVSQGMIPTDRRFCSYWKVAFYLKLVMEARTNHAECYALSFKCVLLNRQCASALRST